MSGPDTSGAERVVLDTNIWLALWLFRDDSVAGLRAALDDGRLIPLRSSATEGELAEVLAREGLFGVAPERRQALLADWQARAELVAAGDPAPWRCRDPLDQKFLDLAVSGGARWLLTRDRDLLKLARKARRVGLAIQNRWPVVDSSAPGTGTVANCPDMSRLQLPD